MKIYKKAFGALYAPLVNVGTATLAWTRGEPARFRSSNVVSRGFCPSCGTPLTYEAPDGIALAIGAFDDPSALAPDMQFGTEAKIGYVDRLHDLPSRDTMSDTQGADFLASVVSRQHPDHDTETDWKPTS